ncbi:pantetheine-phosphate adenylyltransferase [bacterium]|nr:pantetheine-phosphate adenylyltransferase [bacterium]
MERVGIYAGTFDPLTNGHLDLIERGLKVFDRLVIAVAESSPKQALFTAEERVKLITEALPRGAKNVAVEKFSGLLVDFAREKKASAIVRGLRAVSDYEYEWQMALINRRLAENLETVFLMTSNHCSYISSSMVRQVAELRGDVSSMVPAHVAEALKQRFGG